jgi:para-aminobenzoate synthetase component I
MMAQFPAGDLLQLFRAVPCEVERLCLFAGLREQGFEDTLAWGPVAGLEGVCSAATELRRELLRFVEEHSRQGRLVLGFCSYELGHHLQGLPLRRKARTGTPDYCWLAYDSWLTRVADTWTVQSANADFLRQLEQARLGVQQPRFDPGGFEPMQFRSSLSSEDYRRAYGCIQEYIRAGDVYQVNLTYALRAQTALAGRELFPFVAQSNPVEHLAYFEGAGYAIHSASPERFVRIRARQIETFPIKGTRPRGTDPEQDRAQLAQLLGSQKEQAELNMITDLLRNDLAEVCAPGSVQVAEHRVPRAGPKVWHTGSRITGTLRDGLPPLDAVLSMLPGGSISGCPKRRALEIIDELEACERGVYTGVIGRLAPDGSADFSVAIRTLLQQGSEVSLGVGGGIVYDSEPEEELRETRLKAASFSRLPAWLPANTPTP